MKRLIFPRPFARSLIPHPRLVVAALLFAAAPVTYARTDFELYGDARSALAAEHLHADATTARRLRHGVAREAQAGTPLASLVAQGETAGSQEAALRYAAGTQEQYFCRGKGLVFAAGAHDDGSWSKLVLVDGRREMIGGSYAQMGDGQWTYELANSFRPAERSQLWMTDGHPQGFTIIEVRPRDATHTDKGVWDFSWDDAHRSRGWSVNGNIVEPTRLFMAQHYHMWGGWDLGYRLKFAVGAKDELAWTFQDSSGLIEVTAAREVVEHLPAFRYQDAAGTNYDVDDCFHVTAKIRSGIGKKPGVRR